MFRVALVGSALGVAAAGASLWRWLPDSGTKHRLQHRGPFRGGFVFSYVDSEGTLRQGQFCHACPQVLDEDARQPKQPLSHSLTRSDAAALFLHHAWYSETYGDKSHERYLAWMNTAEAGEKVCERLRQEGFSAEPLGVMEEWAERQRHVVLSPANRDRASTPSDTGES